MKTSQHPEAAFLATMTASATHEVRNVLAIIKESAGLIEDMVHVFARKGTLDNEKVFRAVGRIDAQVRRGAELLTNLNRLSHALDAEVTTVDLGTEVEQIAFLSQRFARKRGHQVSVDPREVEARARVHPLHLHMALFAAVECCLEELPDGALVTLSVSMREEVPMVQFRGVSLEGEEVARPTAGEAWAAIRRWTEALGAHLEQSDTGFGIRILFPPAAGADIPG